MGKTIAIITARGGSKRIPKKNIKAFCGKPIIAYAIQAAIDSNIFDEVMVSTDSEEIAEIARKYGATVPFMRSEKNSDDYATTEDVIMEVVNQYRELGKEYEYVCCLYPTTPFITSEILQKALMIMERERPAVVIPIVQFSYPPQRCFIIDEKGYAKFKYPEYVQTRSQDLEKQYHDAGQFYIYNVEKLFANRGIIEEDFMSIVLPEICVQDIDTVDDWKMAELKYRLLYSEE
ncbi:MAG: pseudaminic acid cytidylyltransferase [Lachnospiraceae bacterium]|nr:pseudaminic acid cytidylyltransferase [Lachnospiraceae bacterium]